MEKRALGRGLNALIPQKIDTTLESSGGKVLEIKISSIKTNKHQPRFEFNEEKLAELVNSIKEKGVVQPVLVRKREDGYELIAGERRLRAVTRLGYETIPAILKDVSDLDALEIALIENLQREELNPIEEGGAFQKLVTDFGFTQERIAQSIGKDRTTIANAIRILGLPQKIKEFLAKGAISAGHAKALLGLPTEQAQVKLAAKIIKKGLSVRETERAVGRRLLGVKKADSVKDPDITEIENSLQHLLGTKVRILQGKKRGRIEIDYFSTEDLNRIIGIIAKR